MFYLQKCKNEALKLNKGNYDGFINLTESCISELQWWQKSFDSVNDIYHPLPQLTIYSDAYPNNSGGGGGGGLLVENTQHGETGLRRNYLCILMC